MHQLCSTFHERRFFFFFKCVCHLAGWESSNSCSNRTRHRLHPEFTLSPTLSAHCQVLSSSSKDSTSSVNYPSIKIFTTHFLWFCSEPNCYLVNRAVTSPNMRENPKFFIQIAIFFFLAYVVIVSSLILTDVWTLVLVFFSPNFF
jgi:hypothetical protein